MCKEERVRTIASRDGIRLMALVRCSGWEGLLSFLYGCMLSSLIKCSGRNVGVGPKPSSTLRLFLLAEDSALTSSGESFKL